MDVFVHWRVRKSHNVLPKITHNATGNDRNFVAADIRIESCRQKRISHPRCGLPAVAVQLVGVVSSHSLNLQMQRKQCRRAGMVIVQGKRAWAAMGPSTMPGTRVLAAAGGEAGSAAGQRTCAAGAKVIAPEMRAGTSRVGKAAGAGAAAACP